MTITVISTIYRCNCFNKILYESYLGYLCKQEECSLYFTFHFEVFSRYDVCALQVHVWTRVEGCSHIPSFALEDIFDTIAEGNHPRDEIHVDNRAFWRYVRLYDRATHVFGEIRCLYGGIYWRAPKDENVWVSGMLILIFCIVCVSTCERHYGSPIVASMPVPSHYTEA